MVGAQQHFLCRLGDALQLCSCGAADLRDAVLSLELPTEDQAADQALAAQRRCTSVPPEERNVRRRSRIRPQSEF